MESNLEILIPLFVFLPVALIIKIISDNSLRRKLIEKGMVDENIKYLFMKRYTFHPMSNLKWGFVLIGIGLPMLLSQMLPRTLSDTGIFGLMFIFAGIGFVAYYLIAKNTIETKNEEE